jgi:hypothetical protein
MQRSKLIRGLFRRTGESSAARRGKDLPKRAVFVPILTVAILGASSGEIDNHVTRKAGVIQPWCSTDHTPTGHNGSNCSDLNPMEEWYIWTAINGMNNDLDECRSIRSALEDMFGASYRFHSFFNEDPNGTAWAYIGLTPYIDIHYSWFGASNFTWMLYHEGYHIAFGDPNNTNANYWADLCMTG